MQSIKENLKKSKYLYYGSLVALIGVILSGIGRLYTIEGHITKVLIDDSHLEMDGNLSFLSVRATSTPKILKKPKVTKKSSKTVKKPENANSRVLKNKAK